MQINPIIFKSYDVRGIYPSELNEEAAFAIGQAFIQHTRAKKVAVGRDMRLSSPQLHQALIKGILSQGADVFDMGEVVVDLLYFSVGFYKYDAGVMVTASHNPKEYNGLKMIKRKGDAVFMIRGTDIGDSVVKGNFKESAKKGILQEINPWQDYISRALSIVDIGEIKPLKVVVDSGNGMTGKMIPMVEKKLPIKIIPLNFKLDGNFPAHPSNFLVPGAADQVSEKIKEEKADCGFIFDGDGDRMRLLDENGKLIDGDISLMFLSKYFLKKNPGLAIPHTVPCSRALPEWIKKLGGKPIRVAVGFVNVQAALIKNKGLMGGEHPSSHYCFKNNFYGDSGLMAFLLLLDIVSTSGKKPSEMVKEAYHYFRIPETNFTVSDKQGMIDKIKEKYSDGKQDFLDGITVDYKDWWFNVRASNTEPLLRLNIEANTKELLEEKKKELTGLITK